MSARRGPMTGEALRRTVVVMETRDPTESRLSEDSGPEGMLIGVRMRELASVLGLNQRQLALRLDIDPRHFNSLWQDKKTAGLPLILKIARKSGRSIAWVCGEEAARPQIGTANAQGLVTMVNQTQIALGIVYFAEASAAFPQGERVLVDPSSAWADGCWLLVSPRRGGTFFGWAFETAGMRMLERPDGEQIVYQDERHEIIGVIVGAITPPPARPSALR